MSAPEILELTVTRNSGTIGSSDHNEAASSVADTEAPIAERAIDALPPVDTGRDAWLFLVAAFIIDTMVWGLPFSIVRL
jgi:hypothetical protein